MPGVIRPVAGWCAALLAGGVDAAVFDLPPPGNDLVGGERWVSARHEDTLLDLAHRHGLGYDEIRLANPRVDPWLPGEGTPVLLPTRYVLPETRQGLVVNLPERRLYFFPRRSGKVITYPVAVGRDGLDTPTVTTRVVDKLRNPNWYPGPEAQRDRIEAGLPKWPAIVPPGPANPLGPLAIKLGIPEILIHGTDRPNSIGMPVTHGCIRMAARDLNHLVRVMPRGTPVRIVNRRYKVGWQNGVMYLEAHLPDDRFDSQPDADDLAETLADAQANQPDYALDWRQATTVLEQPPGTPRPLWPTAVAEPEP